MVSEIQAVERCIDKLMTDFLGLNAFNFHTERDLQCSLFSYLRTENSLKLITDGVVTELVHAEWPVVSKEGRGTRKLYDLVVWGIEGAKTARKHWGKGHGEQALRIPILIAIEIRHLYGGPSGLKKLSTVEALQIDDDIGKLTSGQACYCYFLAFSDENINTKKGCKELFQRMKVSFEEVGDRHRPSLKIGFVSRDKNIIKVGFSEH